MSQIEGNPQLEYIDNQNTNNLPLANQVEPSQDNLIRPEDFKLLSEIYYNEGEYDIDSSQDLIYLAGNISETTLDFIMKRISFLMKFRTDQEMSEPITINLNTYGGDAYEALGIIDYLKSLPMKINMICYSKAMSAGALLLLSGTGTRKMSENATMMLHELSSDSVGKASDIKSNTKHIKELENKISKILVEHSKKNLVYWQNNLAPDLYLTAKQALALGLIDEII